MASTLITLPGAGSNFALQDMLDKIGADGTRPLSAGDMAALRSRFIELDKLIAGMHSPGTYQAPQLPL